MEKAVNAFPHSRYAARFPFHLSKGTRVCSCLRPAVEVRGWTKAGGRLVPPGCPPAPGTSAVSGVGVGGQSFGPPNQVGRWLTSGCPSKCDPGRTFNEIHSTWQAPPLPGLSNTPVRLLPTCVAALDRVFGWTVFGSLAEQEAVLRRNGVQVRFNCIKGSIHSLYSTVGLLLWLDSAEHWHFYRYMYVKMM